MLTFNKLSNRYRLRGALKLDSAMHIGSGLGDHRVDALFVRSNDKFYLPGSSVRGALRSLIERLAAGLSANPSSVSCFLDNSSNSKCVSANRETLKEVNGWRESRRLTELNILDKIMSQGYLCQVCQLFGSPMLASKVKIHDCFPAAGPSMPSEGTVRYGIGIDRDTESVREGVLFEVEVLDHRPSFQFELLAENLEEDEKKNPEDWGLLALGLLEMLDGRFYLGAKSAVGLGQCHLDCDSLLLEGFSGPEQLRAFLDTGNYPQQIKKKEAVVFLQKKRKAYLDATAKADSQPNQASQTAPAKENEPC